MKIYNKPIPFLLAALILVQIALLLMYGIYDKEEAVKYIYEAGYFTTHGSFSQPKYFFYSGYIFLHMFSNAIGAGKVGVFAVQLLLNALALVCFYKLVLKICSRHAAAAISTLLLVLCIPFQKWTVYLFTESVFFSLLIIYCFVLFTSFNKAYVKPVLIIVLLLLLIISRPTGMLVIPASMLLASYYLWMNKKRAMAWAIWLPGLAALAFLLDTAMSGKGEFDFIKPFVEHHIICGLAGNPGAGAATQTGGNPLADLLQYISQNFTEFLALGFRRLASFFGLVRPYYSNMHNLLLIAGFYPVYIFASFGLHHVYKRSRAFFIFSMALIATFAFSVMLTCDDWHNRFIMPVMPLILLYAGIGATQLYAAVFKRNHPVT